MSGELSRRLAVAGVGIPVCIAVTWVGGLAFVAGIALLAGVSAREYVGLYAREGGRHPLLVPTLAGAAGFPVLVRFLGLRGAWELTPLFLMGVSVWALARRRPQEGPVTTAALTAFGALYLGGLLGFSVPLRESVADRAAGTLFFFLPVTVTWIADTAAYMGGRRWGRRPLAPVLSPNKTVAGAVSALVAGPAAAALYGWFLLPLGGAPYPVFGDRIEPATGLLVGLVVAGAAILGDLVESALKRECRAKDSSDLLPGHGGLLDRMDSLLWAFPALHLFLWMWG